MHNKQALSRYSTPCEAIQAELSACNAQFYVCFVSSAYVCALERGKVWEFWGTWGIFTVAITSRSLASLDLIYFPGNGLCRNGAFCLSSLWDPFASGALSLSFLLTRSGD